MARIEEEKDPAATRKAKKLPEDAVPEAKLPPLSQKGIVVRSLAWSSLISWQMLISLSQEGKSFPVVVSDLEGLDRFWFQVYGPNHYTTLQLLMKDMDDLYNSAIGEDYAVQDIMEVKEGSVLAARFQGVWHRVELKCVLVHNSKVKLEYIDFGTKAIQ